MRSYARLIQFGVILTAALVLIATAVKSQAPSAQTWEYSSVTGSPVTLDATKTGLNSLSYKASATICYATPQGCRKEVVTTTGPGMDEGAISMMTAASKLGEQGWELTTSTDAATDSFRERVLYFRRLKHDSK